VRSERDEFVSGWNESLRSVEKELLQHLVNENEHKYGILVEEFSSLMHNTLRSPDDIQTLQQLGENLQFIENKLFNRRVNKAVRLLQVPEVTTIRKKMFVKDKLSSKVQRQCLLSMNR